MNKLIIVGSGGFAREVANVALSLGFWSGIYFMDDNKTVNTLIINNLHSAQFGAHLRPN
jgi:hypothetical protein